LGGVGGGVDWSAVGLAGILQLRWSCSEPNPPYMVRRGDTKTRARRGDGHGNRGGYARPNYNVWCRPVAGAGGIAQTKPKRVTKTRHGSKIDSRLFRGPGSRGTYSPCFTKPVNFTALQKKSNTGSYETKPPKRHAFCFGLGMTSPDVNRTLLAGPHQAKR
jgi:hypothetical protein